MKPIRNIIKALASAVLITRMAYAGGGSNTTWEAGAYEITVEKTAPFGEAGHSYTAAVSYNGKTIWSKRSESTINSFQILENTIEGTGPEARFGYRNLKDGLDDVQVGVVILDHGQVETATATISRENMEEELKTTSFPPSWKTENTLFFYQVVQACFPDLTTEKTAPAPTKKQVTPATIPGTEKNEHSMEW